MRSHLPDKNFFLLKAVPNRVDVTIVNWVASGNDGHLFRAHSDELGRDVACKIIPHNNLQRDLGGGEIWRAEILKANALRNPVVVKVEHICKWPQVPMHSAEGSVELIDCVALISEFVEGPSLKRFAADHSDEITVPFVVQWLGTMLNLFFEMQQRKITHGDLHAGNILVEDQSSYNAIGPRFVFRVTDFGVGDTTSEPRFKDDYLQLADTLAQLLRIVDYQACAPKEKFFFNILRHHFLARHLVETDLTLDNLARQPRMLLRRLDELDVEFTKTVPQSSTRLLTPFDFLSCEQVGEAADLLHALYSDRFLGLSEIESQNNVVVTGPRGCGKSTVFRSLSLDQKMRVKVAAPNQTSYIGIYYQCNDLYFAFPRYVLPDRDEGLDIPIHYITATLLASLLDSIESWAKQHFIEEFVRAESKIADILWTVLDITAPQTPDYLTFKAVVSALNKQRQKASERHRFVNDAKREIGRSFGPDVLLKACEVLRAGFTFSRELPIYFFIDDYSSPKVTKELQASLNRLFMQRSSVCFFKLSTESPVSFAKHDIDGKIYVESREFILHNLGLVYLHAGIEPKLSFIDDVFRRRLKTSSSNHFALELQELVGNNVKQNNNELARSIRNGEKPLLWGRETLCNLCSGDIHYLISLVGDMVRLSGGPDKLPNATDAPFKISQSTQSRAIREAAGSFLKNLRGVPRCGEQLVNIVEAFGNVANSHLKYIDSKNEGGTSPKQATRIEPYAPFALSDNAQRLYDELLRYSVFIEDFRGKSRRGSVVPRLFLRRFLIPHFNLTFSTRDSIELEPNDFELFLCSAQEFERKFRLKGVDDARRLERQETESQNQLLLDIDTPSQ
ncbi:MAG: protein kinase [Verrucomicrobia bacterium]|nr:protein kinase [Verrucomicrobiota bacterium]